MWISDTSIKRPVFATMVILSFMVLGIVSMTRLGIDLFPEVNFPFVNVSVVYPGAAPEEVETLVTRADRRRGRRHQRRQARRSRPRREGVSRVGIELRLEVDPQAAAAEVREKVAAIRDRLPKEIEDPTIQRFDVAALPIMTLRGRLVAALRRHAPRRSKTTSSRCSSRSTASRRCEVNGGEVREIQVNLDPRRLEALEPADQPRSPTKLAADNLDVPGGQVMRDGQSDLAAHQGRVPDASTRSRTSSCAPTAARRCA